MRPPARRGRQGLAGLALVLTVWAATPAAGRELPPRLRFQRLTTDRGLSDSTVEAVLQDHRGFMWFGTADGLNRYDGYEFKVYIHDDEDPSSIASGYVWDLYEDSQGVLWVSTTRGFSRYVRETDSFVTYESVPDDDSTPSNSDSLDVLEDSRGELWVATSLGLNRMERATETFVRYLHDPEDPASLGDNDVQFIFEDSQQRLWFGTGGGLDVYDRESEEFRHFRHDPDDDSSLSHNYIRGVEEDSFGNLWVATENGLNRTDIRDPGRFTRYRFDPDDPDSIQDNQVWVVFEDSRKILWIGTDRGGLGYFDREREAFVHHTHDPSDPSSISSNVVYVIYEDRGGDLWTGNYAGGVNYVNRASTAFAFYTHVPGDPSSLNHQSVLCFLEDRAGGIWIGTEDGVASFDRSSGRFVRYRHDPRDPSSLTAPAVTALHQDRDGVLWVGTHNGGLNRFDRRRNAFTRLRLVDEDSPSDERSQVWAIEDDRHGDLWVGTSGGLYRVDRRTGASVLYRDDDADPTSLLNNLVWDVHEDAEGRLWVGTHYGLGLFDRDRQAFENFQHRPGDETSLSWDQITMIHEDPEGRLWLGTHGGGVSLLDSETRSFTSVRASHGLPSDVVLSVASDDRGYLWLGTNRGLARLDPRTGSVLSLDGGDGVQGRQFNRMAALLSRTGELYFGGINGFNVFSPEEVGPNTLVPPVVLTGFQIFNESAPVGEDQPLQVPIDDADLITLRHDQSVLSFDFAALNYRNPARNRYAYVLEGFDDDWVEAGTQRTATYTNLDPGRYTFRVKASNNSGVWNEQGAAIRLNVLPPYWATWWFRLLSLMVVLAAIAAVFRLRLRTITKHNLELQAEIGVRRRVEEERARLMVEMEEKNVMLERQNAELERFAYTVSHDLKSPLVTIHGFLGLLEKDVEAGDKQGMLRDISQISAASRTMGKLLGDVLELSRIGRVANPSEEVSLAVLAMEAADLVGVQIEERGVEIEIDPRMPTVVGDRMRLLEVFQNLIGNAASFMGEQARPRVSIGATTEDGHVVCFVRDNGRGIEPRYHDRIFGLFQRLDPDGKGSGIGLALVKRIVEVHGGRIWVESEGRGRGATFWFSLAPSVDSPRE